MRLKGGSRSREGCLNEGDVHRFVRTTYPVVVANLALITGSREEAEDAVQEALARAWARSEREEVRSVGAWVTVVALNLVRSRFRRLGAERRALTLQGAGPGGDPATLGDLDRAGELLDLRAAVSALPRRQREVVILRYYLDLDVAGVARALGIGTGTAKKALHRARESLGRSLDREHHHEAERGSGNAPPG